MQEVQTENKATRNTTGQRISTRKMDGNKISVNFFAMSKQYETQCNPILFKEYGKIVGTNKEMSIDDLFDQFELDLDKMLGL